ncbi:hypothetical protein RN001_003956 [Aquatica leii]|uniref:Uncharacterized protein n=1 Tax=Aquatica leii TaxID=1421715 RepID=A0AAN7ST45_9COLE|nr:hypothetical protein RN001_003956 [Aquatica leii]
MDKSTEEFIGSFHALTGVTIGERRKDLFRLINNTHDPINTNLLQPKNPLEETFKIEVLLRFNKFTELIDVLKRPNRVLTKKILKRNEFIDEVSKQICVKDLMILLSEMCFSTKLKIVSRLGRRTENAEEYFEALLENYGLYVAARVLPSCNLNLILKYACELTPRQLLTTIRKYPSAIEQILESLNLNNSKKMFAKFKYVFKHLKKDVSLLLKLLDRYGTNFELSSKATHHVLKTNPPFEIKKFTAILNKRRVAKSYPQFYYRILPGTIAEFTNNFYNYFELLNRIKSKPKQLRIMLDGFRKAYDSDLWDYPVVSTRLIKMMTPEDRLKWMEKRSKPNNVTDYEWISLFNTDESVPKLKELISWTSNIKIRAKLIAALVQTCQLNNDQNALLEVLNFIWKDHRWDHFVVLQQFLWTITECELEEQHWNILNEFTRMLVNESLYSCSVHILKEKYIEFCLDRNKPIDLLLADLIASNKSLNILHANPNYEKACLKLSIGIINSNYKGEELVLKHIQYIQCLQNWNRRHPKNRLPLLVNDSVINYLKSNMEKNYLYEDIATDYILLHYEETQQLLHPLVNNGHCYRHLEISNWLLRNRPMVFLKHLEPLVKRMVQNNSISAYVKLVSRYYTHLGIPQQMSEVCADGKDFACIISAAVQPFRNISKCDLNNENKLSNAVFDNITHLFEDDSYVEKILNFHSDNVNESEILKLLSNRKTSVKKHAWLLGKLNLKKSENLLIGLKNANAERPLERLAGLERPRHATHQDDGAEYN